MNWSNLGVGMNRHWEESNAILACNPLMLFLWVALLKEFFIPHRLKVLVEHGVADASNHGCYDEALSRETCVDDVNRRLHVWVTMSVVYNWVCYCCQGSSDAWKYLIFISIILCYLLYISLWQCLLVELAQPQLGGWARTPNFYCE